MDLQKKIGQQGVCIGNENDLPVMFMNNKGCYIKQDDDTYVSLSEITVVYEDGICKGINFKKKYTMDEILGTNQEGKPLLTSYIEAAMENADIKMMSNGEYYGCLPDCQGVWASELTRSECYNTLRSVLEEWIILKLTDGDTLPTVNGITIGIFEEEDIE